MPLRHAPRQQFGAAVVLAFLAGAVDAIGFSKLGGLFVSFMSGNSTRLGVFLEQGDFVRAGQVGGIILAFVAGAALGFLLARRTAPRRRAIILLSEALLLAAASAATRSGADAVGIALMTGAMGLENATFAGPDGEARISLTFMTGALVKVGEGVATALSGGPRWTWTRYLVLWMGLTLGAFVGALSYAWFGTSALCAVAALLVLVAMIVTRDGDAA